MEEKGLAHGGAQDQELGFQNLFRPGRKERDWAHLNALGGWISRNSGRAAIRAISFLLRYLR
jgi:hypothetical protein